MKTQELITLLANGASAVPAHTPARRLAVATGIGIACAAIAMLGLLGPNPELARNLQYPMFWLKLGFTAATAAVALFSIARLSRPGVRWSHARWMLGAPVLFVWLVALVTLADAAPVERVALVLGATWRTCALNIAALSVPLLVAILWTVKTLAPTRLRIAGAVGGCAAGALAAFVYAFHCPELEAPFLGTWYVLGILIPTVVGALIGPRALNW